MWLQSSAQLKDGDPGSFFILRCNSKKKNEGGGGEEEEKEEEEDEEEEEEEKEGKRKEGRKEGRRKPHYSTRKNWVLNDWLHHAHPPHPKMAQKK